MSVQPLTLAFLTNLYPPYVVGGNELFTHDIVQALRARGHTVHVLTGQGKLFPQDGYTHQVLNLELDYKEAIFLGGLPMTTQRILQWHIFSPSAYRRVLATLRAIQPDLIVAANLYMASAAPLVAARRLPAPLVVQPMDKWLVYLLKDLGRLVPAGTLRHQIALTTIKRTVQPLLNRWGAPHYILAVSEFIRRFHLQAGYPAATSKAIYLGIPLEQYRYQPHPYPQQRPWRLLFAGQLWEGKGPQVAVEAVSRLRNDPSLPPVELDIFGSGTPRFVEHLNTLIQRYGLVNQVRLRGLAPREQLINEFQSHDLFLFCSIWDEPFSIVLQEARASGIPIIATTAGGTPEGVRHEVDGLLVPPDDPVALAAAITRYMQEATFYETAGAAAARLVQQQWGFDTFLDRLEATYQAIVQSQRTGTTLTFAEQEQP
jgi:glycosyltransferase involved in cell wall biosynthesis